MLAFLTGLLHRGDVLLRESPRSRERLELEPEVGAVLESAFARHRLDLAGPPIALDAKLARRSAEVVELACWLLVQRLAPREGLARLAADLGLARTPSEHLSADLFLRYLPIVHRRARALDQNDPLGAHLESVLRRFPLSGVLAAIEQGPAVALDFGGHEGLELLYAERLSARSDTTWVPQDGRVRERLELVLEELGRANSPLLVRREVEPNSESDDDHVRDDESFGDEESDET